MTHKLARQLAHGFAALAFFAGFFTASAQAQTNVTTGGGEVRAFLGRSGIVYAATYGGGLVESANTGTTWTRRTTTASNPRYFTSISGGTTGYFVIGGEEGLIRTSDGTTFTHVLFEPIQAVAVNGTTVLAGMKGVGIMRSTDSGASFAQANNSSLTSLDIVSIAADPTNANHFYLAAKPDGQGNKGGVFESTDGGQTWAVDNGFVTAASTRFVAAVVFDSAGKLYAAVQDPFTGGGGAFTKTGASWSAASNLFSGVVSLHRDANTGTKIWAGTSRRGVSSGSGAFTEEYNTTPPNIMASGANAVATIPGNANVVLQALRGSGVWRSAAIASPRTWAHVNLPGSDRVLSATGVSSGGSVILAGLYAGGVWRSNDGGGTFNAATTAPGGTTPAGFARTGSLDIESADPFVSVWQLSASNSSDNTIYAATGAPGMFYGTLGFGTFRWNGSCWQAVGVGAPSSAVCAGAVETGLPFGNTAIFGVTVNPTNDQVAYVSVMAGGAGTYRRSGASWSLVNLGPVLTPQMRGVVAAPSGTRFIGMPFDDKPIYSGDGATYSQSVVSQMGFERLRFFSVAQNPSATTQWIAGSNKGIFRSTNDGVNWTRVTGTPLQKLAVTGVGFRTVAPARAFAGDFDGNRYCSSDGGQNWTMLAPALRAGVNAIRVIGGNLYYLTDGGGMFLETGSC
ncbi:MAG TPA: hypothetical protein VM029_19790 [Opitutaceae bacterium]|nr:hypothetical protein [Opitutaceae bacterium]